MTRRASAPSRRVHPRLPDTLAPARLPDDDLVDEALLRGLVFASEVDLAERKARLVDIEECRFAGTPWAGSDLDKITVSDSIFDQCDLANTSWDHAGLQRIEVSGCRMTGAALPAVLLRHVLFRDCVADLSAWRSASCTKVEFVGCRLQRADFGSADLRGAVFRRCDLTGAELSSVRARGTVFVDCTWDQIRGIDSLSGATVTHRSPVDALTFTATMATALGITLGDPDDFPEPE